MSVCLLFIRHETAACAMRDSGILKAGGMPKGEPGALLSHRDPSSPADYAKMLGYCGGVPDSESILLSKTPLRQNSIYKVAAFLSFLRRYAHESKRANWHTTQTKSSNQRMEILCVVLVPLLVFKYHQRWLKVYQLVMHKLS